MSAVDCRTAPAVGRYLPTDARQVMDNYRHNVRRIVLTINTSFIPPTDTEGSKYGAIDETSRLFTFVHAAYDLTTPENHLAAAIALIREHYYGEYVLMAYESAHDSGYVFTFEANAI